MLKLAHTILKPKYIKTHLNTVLIQAGDLFKTLAFAVGLYGILTEFFHATSPYRAILGTIFRANTVSGITLRYPFMGVNKIGLVIFSEASWTLFITLMHHLGLCLLRWCT